MCSTWLLAVFERSPGAPQSPSATYLARDVAAPPPRAVSPAGHTVASHLVAGGSQHGVDSCAVQPSGLDLTPEACGDLAGIESFTVRPRFRPCLIAIGYGQQPPLRCERLGGASSRVSRAVEPLVVLCCDRRQAREGGTDARMRSV